MSHSSLVCMYVPICIIMCRLLDEIRGGKTKPLPPINKLPQDTSMTKDNQTGTKGDLNIAQQIDQDTESTKLNTYNPSTPQDTVGAELEALDPGDIDICIAEIERAQSQPPATPPKNIPRTKV